MTLSRRDFLRLAGLASASLALSACAPVYNRLAGGEPPLEQWPTLNSDDFLRLNRLTFGGTAGERNHVSQIGLNAFIEEQLAYEAINNDPADLRLRDFETLNLKANELWEYGNKLFDDLDPRPVISELRQATLIRQVYSPRQLYEVMVEFWNDHFNISVDKGDCWYLKTVDDREVIRKHALGNFRDLLWASAHSPAMMVYLDNQANEYTHPNENYARELMELHTLSVNGGYSQTDVMELARCLTGWTVKQNFWLGEFEFKQDLHDTGIKTVLGMTIEPNGQAEAERVLEALAVHPATARFISTKLVRRFIADDPPAELIDQATETFLQTDGDIKSVLRVILFEGLPLAQPKYKRPANFVVSSLRMLNAHYGDARDGFAKPKRPLLDMLGRMGQPLFGWPTPDGYPDVAARWVGSLMPRWQFALALARNEIDGTSIDLSALFESSGAETPEQFTDQLSTLLLGAPLDSTARDSLITSLQSEGADDESLPQIITAGLIASPAFQWR
jgi:hypothetical protein